MLFYINKIKLNYRKISLLSIFLLSIFSVTNLGINTMHTDNVNNYSVDSLQGNYNSIDTSINEPATIANEHNLESLNTNYLINGREDDLSNPTPQLTLPTDSEEKETPNYPDFNKPDIDLPPEFIYWRDIDFSDPLKTYFGKYDSWVVKHGDSMELIIGLIDINLFTPTSDLAIFLQNRGCTVLRQSPAFNGLLVECPIGTVPDFMFELEKIPGVRYLEPNGYVQANFIPNDPLWINQWGPQILETDIAWDTQMGNHDILVAIIDTGIDYTHEDLANYISGGYDFINDDSDPMDDHGHGTHCAGIVAATINNDIGIAGIANVSVAAEKALDAGGWGDDFSLASSIYHAVDILNADILSNSWGSYSDSSTIHDACIHAYNMGKIIVAAAGNLPISDPMYPAGYEEVIAVTATNAMDEYAGWAGYGDWVELCAPGESILSTFPGNSYEYWDGTSMATPHVAAVAALAWSEYPSMDNEQLRIYLQLTTVDLGDPGFDIYHGYGRISARLAVEGLPAHDMKASIKIEPEIAAIGTQVDLTAIAINAGTNDELDVYLHLYIDDLEVYSELFSLIPANGGSMEFTYPWIPPDLGVYNISCSIDPVTEETYLENNYDSQLLTVISGITPELGDYIDWILTDYDDNLIFWFNSTYESEIIDYTMLVRWDQDAYTTIYLTVDTLTREIIDSTDPYYIGLYYPMQIDPATLYSGAMINWWSSTGIVVGETTYYYKDQIQDVWILEVFSGNAFIYVDKQSGVWMYYFNYGAPEMGYIVDTNLIPDIKYPHELKAILTAPETITLGEDALISASVHNIGLSDEYDVILELYINGLLITNEVYPVLPSGVVETLDYLWTPMDEGLYNVSAYVVPIPDEEIILNNMDTQFISVSTLANYNMSEVTFNWFDAYINGFNLELYGDDVFTSISLPFEFKYYDTYFNEISVGSNGWLSFIENAWDYYNVPFPIEYHPYAVAPFWGDLYADFNIYVWITDEFAVIEYHDYYYLYGDYVGTFEVVFFPDGTLLFQHQNIVNDLGATVGLNYGFDLNYYTVYTEGLSGISGFSLLFSPEGAVEPGLIAILQDAYPWGYGSTMDILTAHGYSYDIISSSSFGLIDLSVYEKVIISSDQTQDFYNTIDLYMSWLEDYVATGGILEVHAADTGWNYGQWVGLLPGGCEYILSPGETVDIVDPSHTILNEPNYITDEELDGWYYSYHGYLINIGYAAVILSNGIDPVLIEQEFGSGRIIISTQPLEWGYAHGYSFLLENIILYFPELEELDYNLIVDLDSPSSLLPGMDTWLTAYVYNAGPATAANVELQLWINGTLVVIAVYPTLSIDETGILSYYWLPPSEGVYDITVVAVPIGNEIDPDNNVITKQVVVGYPIINFELGDFITLLTSEGYLAFDFVYVDYITPTNVFLDIGFGDWIIVDTVTRVVLASSISDWEGTYYIGQVETEIDIGDTINWYYLIGEVIGTEFYNWNGCILEAWEVYLPDWDQYVLFHKETGVWLAYYYSYPDGMFIRMEDTSMIEWVLPEHETSIVGLEVPWLIQPEESGLLNITVSNNGLSDETDVEIQIWLNENLETILILPFIMSLTTETVSYLWTAPSTEDTYEMLVDVVPVPGENYWYDNYAWDWPIVSRYTWVSNFEIFVEGFETDGLWHLIDDSSPYPEYYSPVHAMWYGQDETGNYDTGTTNSGSLITPYILLEDVTAFTFFSWYETEESGHTFDLKDVYIILPDGSWILLGWVSGTMHEWIWYSFDISAYNGMLVRFAFYFNTVDPILNNFRGWYVDDIIILGNAHVKKFHDLEAFVDVSETIIVGTSVYLAVSVTNVGLNDETDIVLQLWIDNVLVAMTYYPHLFIDETGYLYYLWTPTEVDMVYNITAFAVPVPNELYIVNNVYTVMVTAVPPLVFELGDYIDIRDSYGYPFANFTYLYYTDATHVYIDLGYNWGQYIVVDLQTRLIVESNIGWVGYYYIGQIATDINIGDTINWHSTYGEVVDTAWYNWNGMLLEAWEIYLPEWGDYIYHHKETGVWLEYGYQDYVYMQMIDTSLIEWFIEHDLSIELETFGYTSAFEQTPINASVYNNGINDETNIEVQVWIDGSLEDIFVIPYLASETSDYLSYLWTPTENKWYNITFNVIPVTGENYVDNNFDTRMIIVDYFYWDESFEEPLEGWYMDGLWHLIDGSSPYPEYYSPVHAMWYGQDETGNYDTGIANSGVLITPIITLSPYTSLLVFFSWYETEESVHSWDLKDVFIILPDSSWILLSWVSGTMHEWTPYSFDISSYAGLDVQFAFKFDTIDSIGNDYRGWYIDDIIITISPPEEEPLLKFDIGDFFTLCQVYEGQENIYITINYVAMVGDEYVHIEIVGESETDIVTFWCIVNIYTRFIENTSEELESWNQTYFYLQIETNVDIGDTINIYTELGTIVGTTYYNWNGMLLEAWNVSIMSGDEEVFFIYHKETGIFIFQEFEGNSIFLSETNMILWEATELSEETDPINEPTPPEETGVNETSNDEEDKATPEDSEESQLQFNDSLQDDPNIDEWINDYDKQNETQKDQLNLKTSDVVFIFSLVLAIVTIFYTLKKK